MQNTIKALYTKRAVLYHRLFIDVFNFKGRFEKFFRETNYLHSQIKVLDAGCGTGAISRILHRVATQKGLSGITYHAFDFTPAMLDEFKRWMLKENIHDIDLKQADLLDPKPLASDWREYDLIVCFGVLEYIPKEQLEQTLRYLASLLNKSGVLIISVTRRNLFTTIFIGWWWKARTFREQEIRGACQNTGLVIIRESGLGIIYNPLILELKKII